MRKLMLFTLGFGAVCLFCAYTWISQGLLWAALGCGILFLLGLVFSRKWKILRIPTLIFLGCSVSFLWFSAFYSHYLAPALHLDGQLAQVTAVCTDYGFPSKRGTAVDGRVILGGRNHKVRFYVRGQADIGPGDTLKGVFKFRVTTPGGHWNSTFHKGNGIFLLAYQEEDVQWGQVSEIPWDLRHTKLRRDLKAQIEASFPEDTRGFAKALFLGDRTGLNYETKTAFKTAGIMHIVAVSGLHVSILFALVYLMCLKRRFLTAVLGIPILLLFAAAVGFTPSVTRACIMEILVILALALGRDYDAPTALSFSALVMMVWNPLVVTSVSFQLSFGAVAGIMLIHPRLFPWLKARLGVRKSCRFKKLRITVAGSVSVSVSAMVLTAPLTAVYFGSVSLVGILSNLLILWAVGLCFYGILAACVLGFFWPSAGAGAAWAISWLIRYVLGMAELLSRFPLAAVYLKNVYILLWLVFCYVLLGVFLLMKKKEPLRLCSCLALGLAVAVCASWLEPMVDSTRMTVLDVGQGQSVILQSEGKAFLVDCGGDYDEDVADLVSETLFSMGIFRLDGVIITHFDRDHVGGLPHLMTRMDTGLLLIPDLPGETAENLEELTPACTRVSDNLLLRYGGTKMTVFGPNVVQPENESSLCVLFQSEKCDILITGDRGELGEQLLLRQMEFEPVDVLVAGHHGSKHSTGNELLEAVQPETVVISCGENHYGHPAPEVLRRLAEHGCAVYRTDLNGTITIRR